MGVELPGVAEVEGAIALWRATDPRLGALLERHADTTSALRHYGLILWDQGQPQAAAQVFSGAVALDPDDARLWADLAGALNAAGQLPQAAACMEESLVRDAMQAEGWLRLGSVRSAMSDPGGAETALKTALAIDPTMTDARLSLGLVYFHAKRFAEAADQLHAVLEASPVRNAAVQACYGQALAHGGAFPAAAAALREAVALEPGNPVMALKRAQAQYITDLIAGSPIDQATAACRADPAVTDDEFEKISRQAFHLLAAFGHTEPALRLGAARLLRAPNDPEQAYLLAILKGEPIQRAPDRYVATFFDQFADEFDAQLVGILGYTAFAQLAALVETHATTLGTLLDCGCGTGLAGPLLARPGRHLTGIDLSQGMLDKARARGCYDALVVAEAVAYLADRSDAFDLIFAADVLIYVGDPAALMAGVARALVPGGLFAFTIETSAEGDLTLLASGRFAHGLAPVLAQGAALGLATVVTKDIDIRYETRGFVAGTLIVMRKV